MPTTTDRNDFDAIYRLLKDGNLKQARYKMATFTMSKHLHMAHYFIKDLNRPELILEAAKAYERAS